MKNRFIKEYFNFSRREINGLIILGIILVIILSLRIIENNYKPRKRYDFSKFENEIDEFISLQTTNFENTELFCFDPNTASTDELIKLGFSPRIINEINSFRKAGRKFYKPEDLLKIKSLKESDFEIIKEYIVIEKKKNYNSDNFYKNNSRYSKTYSRFDFDPNIADKETLLKLGFKYWQADNIIKYRNKGGKFSIPEDLYKIYGIDSVFVSEIIDYVKIENIALNEITNNDQPQTFMIEINSANAEMLQRIKGIGPVYANRIIKYRDRLGGFINIEQLKEIYGINDELFKQLKIHTSINPDLIHKININTADYKTLISHPYIDEKHTKIILNFREFAGKIKSFDELLKQKAIEKEFYEKISPYISVE
ncbi:MAG: helix-hairpin-helix domain-containing protein [Flavobacterium piscis]|nr:helix-hairpin-helix domain-containing protein [Flavobacterium piscis]